MAFKTNTIQLPKYIVKHATGGDISGDGLKFVCLRIMYRDPSDEDIITRYNLDENDCRVALEFLDVEPKATPQKKAPAQKKEYNQGGQQQQYPVHPAAPEDFARQLREKTEELLPGSMLLTDAVINDIYAGVDGNEEAGYATAVIAWDYHENKQEVKSPGGLMRSYTRGKSPEELIKWAEDTLNNGSGVTDRGSRMKRSMEKAQNYVRNTDGPKPNKEFFDEETDE
jgi:hypothetical protein